jgi:putative ABC transport system permease protein
MLTSYLKLSLRLLARNPFFTFINVAGLSVGFAVFFILWQYSQSELRSDQFHHEWERIYRFGTVARWTDDKVNWEESWFGTNDAALTSMVANQYAEIQSATRLFTQNNFIAMAGYQSYLKDHGSEIFFTSEFNNRKNSFIETKIAYGDANFFSFFKIPLIEGSEVDILKLAGSVALSEKTAIKYFGSVHAIGKILLLNDKITLRVSGVFKNTPRNTHLDLDAIISSEVLKNQYSQITQPWWAPTCYFKLNESADAEGLVFRINKDLKEQIKKVGFGDWPYGETEIYLQALNEMPFQSYRHDFYTAKSRVVLIILQYSSLAILLLAWINYVNLAVASSRKRFKEVAARKTIGACSNDLTIQFIIESLVINLISLLLALTIVQLIKSPIEIFFGFYVADWTEISLSTLIIALAGFVGGILFTGVYPAAITLRYNPKGLFGIMAKQRKGDATPLILSTVQYSVATSIAVLVFAVSAQMEFIMNRDIGLSKEQTLVVDLPISRTEYFKSQLISLTKVLRAKDGISQLTVSQSVPGDNAQNFVNLVQTTMDGGLNVECNGGVDEFFIPFFKIKMLAGRNFLADSPADSSAIILSEVTATRLGFKTPDEAIGRRLFLSSQDEVRVVGVFKDYELKPMLKEGYVNYGGKAGLALTYKDFLQADQLFSIPHRISIRVQPEAFKDAIAFVEKKYKEFFPEQVFNWYFLDKVINGKYQQQFVARNQIAFFSFLAISIACLGLLGMISNKVVEKTKEIGIRKVLGAQLHQIAQILLSTTAKQVIIATIIGIPVAYYLTQQYLQKFSERIELQWWHFALPVLILVVIMLATVASVLWRAARSNPVEALKYE